MVVVITTVKGGCHLLNFHTHCKVANLTLNYDFPKRWSFVSFVLDGRSNIKNDVVHAKKKLDVIE